MQEQLEFDLVSPWLAWGPHPDELRLLKEAEKLLSRREQKLVLKKLAAELRYEELQPDRKITTELEELRLLIGPDSWKKSQHQWRRRLRANPSRVRKVILSMRALYEISAIKKHE